MKLLTLFLLSLLSHSIIIFIQAKPDSQTYNAIFSFGDSFADTGNLVVIATPVLKDEVWISKLPYGETFFHYPTGRCSDGRLVLDFLAEEFSLPLVPAYLAHNGSFNQGANFAVAGATTLDFAFFVQNNLSNAIVFNNTSLSVQLGWFAELKPSLCNTSKGCDCEDYFSKSLFIVGEFGANDYAFMMFGGKSVDQMKEYVPMVIETISNATQGLINQGAKTIVIPGLWPDGCTPGNLALNIGRPKEDYDPKTGCLKDLNDLSMYHNSLLLNAVNKLKTKYPHVNLIYAEYYQPIMDFINMPKRFGFIDTPLRSCCGKGDNEYNINFTTVCAMPGIGSCENPTSYVNWDGVHLTEAAYHYIASGWLKGPYAHPPILSANK
ncbi:hypothetical protein LUZ60_009665 [Juncus effusus]|nr:hypothetical protein LUZ60_009665 [Juncus effusus]